MTTNVITIQDWSSGDESQKPEVSTTKVTSLASLVKPSHSFSDFSAIKLPPGEFHLLCYYQIQLVSLSLLSFLTIVPIFIFKHRRRNQTARNERTLEGRIR